MPGTPGERGCIRLPLRPRHGHSTGQVWEPSASLQSVLTHSALGGHWWPRCPVLWPPWCCSGAHPARIDFGGSAGSPRGGLGPCWGLKCNNTPAPGMLQRCPGQQGWSPAGPLGLKPWMRDPPSPRAHPSVGSCQGVCNELGAPHGPPGHGVSGAELGAEGSVCVCVCWGTLWGWWVSPFFLTSMGSTPSP